jgi:hypothetical protein
LKKVSKSLAKLVKFTLEKKKKLKKILPILLNKNFTGLYQHQITKVVLEEREREESRMREECVCQMSS